MRDANYSPPLFLMREMRELLQANEVPFRESGFWLWRRFHFTPRPDLTQKIQQLESDWALRDAW